MLITGRELVTTDRFSTNLRESASCSVVDPESRMMVSFSEISSIAFFAIILFASIWLSLRLSISSTAFEELFFSRSIRLERSVRRIREAPPQERRISPCSSRTPRSLRIVGRETPMVSASSALVRDSLSLSSLRSSCCLFFEAFIRPPFLF